MTSSIGIVGRTLATVVLAIGLTSGCGGDESDDVPTTSRGEASQRVKDAVDLTLALESFAVDSEANLVIGGQKLYLGIEGAVDYTTVVGDVSISVDEDGKKSDVHILTDGDRAWVSGNGGALPELPGGAEWLEGDAQRLASASTFTQTGLIGVVLVLRGVEEVQDEGADEIDGEQVHRYRATITYDDALAAAGDQAEALKSSFSLTGQASSSDLLIEVALDDDGFVRELDIDIDSEFPVDGTYEFELDDPDGDVESPDAPDADTVASGADAEALFNQLLN